MSRKEALSQFINQIHGRPVVVKLNSGVDYRGEKIIHKNENEQRSEHFESVNNFYVVPDVVNIIRKYIKLIFSLNLIHFPNRFLGVLACLDGYMNIALDQTEEYANGQLKNKYGDAFIRGNNVLYISTQKRRV